MSSILTYGTRTKGLFRKRLTAMPFIARRKANESPYIKWQRLHIPRVPNVWWHVQGRKMFDRKYSLAVRKMWGCGSYHFTQAAGRLRLFNTLS